MARITRERTETFTVETYRLHLEGGERQALRSVPGDYVRKLSEAEGHTVNAVLVDANLLDGEGPCEDTELVHVLEWLMACDRVIRCVPLM
ncbi:hypothetical protein OG535_30690 [Kitasatospora sp. NBC_00085]|uniref:hypothetical protein n=1 Tax=unclassified Kitasatospora TaxID=2633591 RepID=UPI00324F350D